MKKLILFLFLIPSIARSDFVPDTPQCVDRDEKAILTIIYESRGESLDGQIMVASVIKTSAFIKGKTPDEIVMAPHQFSCWLPDGRPAQRHVPTSKEIEMARIAWKAAEIGAYTNYWAIWVKTPYWAKYCRDTKRVGRHFFCHLDKF
jgi:spore germination cell wall hydrolase CwlJ-like protein